MFYALTERGYDRTTTRELTDSRVDRLLDTLLDMEEVEPTLPHSEVAIFADMRSNQGTSYEDFEVGLRGALRLGYIEEISPGDDRFES